MQRADENLRLLLDPDGEALLTECYSHFTDAPVDYDEQLYQSKRLVMRTLM